MVYREGLVVGSIMLATGLLSVWSAIPRTDDGSLDTDPGAKATLILVSGAFVALIGGGLVVLSLLD